MKDRSNTGTAEQPKDWKKQFASLLTSIDHSKMEWEKFYDFCEISALTLRLPFYGEKVTESLQHVMKKYDHAAIVKFDQMFELMVAALEDHYHDFLGEVFMSLEMGSKWKGQFFTPYHVCKMMAQIQMAGDLKQMLNAEGYFTCSDPACGAGALLIAAIEEVRNQGLNPSTNIYIEAQDIDQLASYMCYIQLSLCGAAAKIIHGNSLSMEIYSEWLTPVFFMNNWWASIELHRFREIRKELSESKPCALEQPAPAVVLPPVTIQQPKSQLVFDFGVPQKEAV